ncbi:hypothetical protein BDV06DRAFT_227259 [Aspergillus oleicola]
MLGHGVHEEDFPMLIHNFLVNVHSKNPILNPSTLKHLARGMATEGLGWNEESCLVSIACGLASLAEPFEFQPVRDRSETSASNARDYGTAELYYAAARKRIGMVSTSLLAIQCTYLMGVYEMYTLRPLKAWLSFTQACNMFSAHNLTTSTSSSSPPLHDAETQTRRRLEQMLYWTCVKSECEAREELDLPASSLGTTDFPDYFPSPPGGTPVPEGGGDDGSLLQSSASVLDTLSQQSWFFYLSEIAGRRLANRIRNALYYGEPRDWLAMSIKRIRRVAEELDSQVTKWSEHVPFSLQFDGEEEVPDEFTWVMRVRLLQLRERLCRPFLFILIHRYNGGRGAGAAVNDDYEQEDVVTAFAHKCLLCAVIAIRYLVNKHRHLGSWHSMRQIFTLSLVILAAAESGRVQLPRDWRTSIDSAINALTYWAVESPDLEVARDALKKITDEVGARY